MSQHSEEVILEQIVAAIDAAVAYADVTKADFLAAAMRQDAILRKLEVIGEAAKGLRDLSANDRALDAAMAPDAADWKAAAGMRDRLIHKYWAVDLEIVWSTVKVDLPRLRGVALNLRQRPRGE